MPARAGRKRHVDELGEVRAFTKADCEHPWFFQWLLFQLDDDPNHGYITIGGGNSNIFYVQPYYLGKMNPI